MELPDFYQLWDQYWPIAYDILAQPPPILWIFLGFCVLVILVPIRRGKMNREEFVQRIVSDRALSMLEDLADNGVITWKEAEREMIRMGRNYRWGDLIPKRTSEYKLTEDDIKSLKGRILARREGRKANGEDKPVNIPGEAPAPKEKKLLSDKIGQLIARHKM